MVIINPTPAISVSATGQDANFETRLNATENTIFKLGGMLGKFISTNKNDRGYLSDFSVNASLSETDQSSDDESNYDPPPQNKPRRNVVNIDICRASKDVFDENINLLVPDAEKQGQSGKERIAANDLRIFEEISKEKMSDKELGSAISSHLAEVTMKC